MTQIRDDKVDVDFGKQAISFFDGHQGIKLAELMEAPVFEPGVLEAVGPRLAEFDGVFESFGLFSQKERDGFSLIYIKILPGGQLPAHYHDADCLYLVLSGEAVMGSRVIGARSGFFVPANVRYSYEAGPNGVEVIEFRNTSHFNMHITETSASRWHKLFDKANAARRSITSS